MNWEEQCVPALVEQRVFLSPQHFSRFETAFGFLRNQRFFTKGLCKCAVLAAWDQKNFMTFMDVMHQMEEQKVTNAAPLVEYARNLIQDPDPSMSLFARLSVDFLTKPNQTPSETIILKLSKAWVPLMDSVITASLVLDKL